MKLKKLIKTIIINNKKKKRKKNDDYEIEKWSNNINNKAENIEKKTFGYV